jgi:hypothetical protein
MPLNYRPLMVLLSVCFSVLVLMFSIFLDGTAKRALCAYWLVVCAGTHLGTRLYATIRKTGVHSVSGAHKILPLSHIRILRALNESRRASAML